MALKFKMRDGAARGNRAVRTCDAAERTEVARYRGEEYSSESIGGRLIVSATIYSPTKGQQKTPVATYGAGARYTAERSGEDLIIYASAEDEISQVRTGDQQARDALRKIRDGVDQIKTTQQAANEFWKNVSAHNAVDRR